VVPPSGSCQIECTASDEDGDKLSYEWSANGGNIDGDGAAAIWSAPSSSGTYTITIKVTDSNGGETTDSINITVEVNHPPTITSLIADTSQVIPRGSCCVECQAEDPDGDSLIYTWSASGGSISGEGPAVTWTAPEAVGSYTITVVITDGQGGEATSSLIINVAPNHPPVIDDLIVTPEHSGDFNLKSSRMYGAFKGASCDIECDARDPDEDELSYEWSVKGDWTKGGKISGDGFMVTWTAPSTKDIKVTITVTVSDGRGGTDTKSIVFEVVTCHCGL
jgi:hypothetical protein